MLKWPKLPHRRGAPQADGQHAQRCSHYLFIVRRERQHGCAQARAFGKRPERGAHENADLMTGDVGGMVTADSLAFALRQTVDDKAMIQRAAALG
jgi:hypothetical protein